MSEQKFRTQDIGYVLTRNGKPIRVYLNPERALEDYNLVKEDKSWDLLEVPLYEQRGELEVEPVF